MFPVPAMRFVAARAARRRLLLVPRRLNATQRAPKLVNLALVGQFLTLGQFDEF
jgi:hypothetical protein